MVNMVESREVAEAFATFLQSIYNNQRAGAIRFLTLLPLIFIFNSYFLFGYLEPSSASKTI